MGGARAGVPWAAEQKTYAVAAREEALRTTWFHPALIAHPLYVNYLKTIHFMLDKVDTDAQQCSKTKPQPTTNWPIQIHLADECALASV